MGIRLRREVLLPGAGSGAESRFEGPEIRVGRGEDAHLRLEEAMESPVSRRHARIVWRPSPGPASSVRADGTEEIPGHGAAAAAAPPAGTAAPRWWLEDLGSRNGTFLNEVRIEGSQPLRSGDRIRFGPGGPVFVVSLDAEGPAPFLPGAGTKHGGRRGAAGAILLVAGGLALLTVGIAVVDISPGAEPGPDTAPGSSLPESVRAAAGSGDESEGGRGGGVALEAAPGTPGASGPHGAPREAGGGVGTGEGEGERTEGDAQASHRPGVHAGVVTDSEADPGPVPGPATGPGTASSSLSPAEEALVREARRAVALVWVEDAGGALVTGTAFATRPDGVLVTVRHLVLPDVDASPPRRIGVQFADSDQVWEARLEGVSTELDLAMLRVVTLPWDQIPRIDALNLRPDTLGPGAPVVVVGFAEGGTGEAEGRGIARPVTGGGELEVVTPTQLRIRGPGASGASGSPVLDAAGAVVGVVYGGVEGELHDPGHHRLVAVNAVQVARFLARFPVQRRQLPPL